MTPQRGTPHISAAAYRAIVDPDGGHLEQPTLTGTAPTRSGSTPRARTGPGGRPAKRTPAGAGTSRTKKTHAIVPAAAVHPLTLNPAVFRIVGTPRTQGSKQALVRKDGSVFMREGGNAEAHAMFKSWRAAVADAGRRWLASVGHPPAYDGPVLVDALFLLAKPPSRPKRERLPVTGLDRDKLERALHDGLSVDAPVLLNDNRICLGSVGKLWAVDTTPGAVVRIMVLGDDDWQRFPLIKFVWSPS